MIFNIIRNIPSFLKRKLFWSQIEKKYIFLNQKRWKNYLDSNDKKGVVLIDLFECYPWIHFWSYIVNILSKKLNSEPKFFYFNLYFTKGSYFKLYIYKLIKIFESFNVTEGISEYNLSKKNNHDLEIKFEKLKQRNKKLLDYKYQGIVLGDLIYDTYLRVRTKSSLDFNDKYLKKIFIKAHTIFDECNYYFKNNNVKAVIPSHLSYINYGIISRIAAKKNIPIFMILSENRGNSLLRLHKVDNKVLVAQPPYYNYKKIFKKLNSKDKKRALKIGKNFLERRLSGQFDKNLPYIPLSNFHDKKINLTNKKLNSKKGKIFIFPHCYFDSPHCFRKMIFNDFKEQVIFILKLSKKIKNYDWFYKPHPNELDHEMKEHTEILKEYENVIYLDKNTSHREIIASKPKCIITNHGTIAHEYAAFKIPVLNTGDNKHINYDFCVHLKSKSQLEKVIKNIDYYKEKLNFDRNQIYEYLYMNYEHFSNLNYESKYLKDKYFADPKIQFSNNSKILKTILKNDKESHPLIKKYVETFIEQNISV